MDVLLQFLQGKLVPILLVGAGSIVIGTLATLRKKVSRVLADTIFKSVRRFLRRRKHVFDHREINKDAQIREILIEMRTIAHADRSYVFRFRNGSQFNFEKPIWSITNTHESVTSGITSEIGKMQHILSSSVTEVIACFWVGEDLEKYPGVYQISPQHCNCETRELCQKPNGIYHIVVDELREGYPKVLFREQGIEHILQAPMFEDTNIIGFVGLDFCRGQNVKDVRKNAQLLCRNTAHVYFALQGGVR